MSKWLSLIFLCVSLFSFGIGGAQDEPGQHPPVNEGEAVTPQEDYPEEPNQEQEPAIDSQNVPGDVLEEQVNQEKGEEGEMESWGPPQSETGPIPGDTEVGY